MSGSGDRRGGGPPGSGEHLPPLPPPPPCGSWVDGSRNAGSFKGGRVGFRVGILFRGSVSSRACGLVASVALFWVGCFGVTGVWGDEGRMLLRVGAESGIGGFVWAFPWFIRALRGSLVLVV